MSYWRPVVNAILYSVQFEKELDDHVVGRIAYSLLTEPLTTLTPEGQYQALSDGLATGAPLPTLVQMPQDPAELREFLSRVVARMDDMRPWPTLPYLRLPKESVSTFKNAMPIARISARVDDIQARISRGFYWGTEYGIFIPLKMSSGRIIGMFTPFWDGSDDIVLVDATHDTEPGAVIDELLSATRIDPGTVTRLTAEDLERFTEEYATTPIQDNFRGEHAPGNPVWGGSQVPNLTGVTSRNDPVRLTHGLTIIAAGTDEGAPMTKNWDEVVSAIYNRIQFERVLSDKVVDWITLALVHNLCRNLTPPQVYDTIARGVLFNEPFPTPIPTRHTAEALRKFLSRVVRRMDELRPWPELAVSSVPDSELPRFSSISPAARIETTVDEFQSRLSTVFRNHPKGGTYLLLDLRTGALLGLFAPPDRQPVYVMVTGTYGSDEPHVRELVSAANLAPSRVTRLNPTGHTKATISACWRAGTRNSLRRLRGWQK
ncbi:hypothetical protein ACFVAV_19545 [Nocardia sp. NPDC057663]|uniref:hypothetical protein n=1 Tax=Nocardia sp. NPDC057663 TaxID=3346201 RepID=UPI00367035B7